MAYPQKKRPPNLFSVSLDGASRDVEESLTIRYLFNIKDDGATMNQDRYLATGIGTNVNVHF